MALIRSGATKASTMSAEPRHGHLSIRGLHISHCRARELMGSTSSMEPFFEILTSGPLTLYSPNLIMTWTRRRRVLKGLVGSEVEKMELSGLTTPIRR